ncbi:BLUF domain-containing protein [Polymorphobacter arshaanensis]|uniref:BLUF domain-containing protein n=1 Tax=Glacieibacterium arshaanense TaxID=2511025 RepID=A0A4Y9ENM0_9SPHN|nr:BLUF domain-containing protein [Polymorphobacter arshaanensis]TFU03310.1 BLUF domain-containing protein [Polymorphobacter arshaanensis]
MLLEGAAVMVAKCTGCLIERRDQRTVDCNLRSGASCAATTGPTGRRFYQVLYLGEHGMSDAALDGFIDDIEAKTAERARTFRLTGALMLTKNVFAQLLEGPRDEVEECLAGLKSDPRHANALLVEEGAVGARQFSGWSVSYADAASFIGRTMFRAIAGAALGGRGDINRLVRLMLEAGDCNDVGLDAALQAVADQAPNMA